MKDTKRAVRRHHRQRMMVRARRVYGLLFGTSELTRQSDQEIQDWICRNYNHLKPCSCFLCGNQRKWHGPTVQERRLLQRLQAKESEIAIAPQRGR